MHTLTIFPRLLDFVLLAPLLLRLTVGGLILLFGWERYKKTYKWTSIIYIVTSVFLIIGLYTQIASIVGIGLLKFDYYIDFYRNKKTTPIPNEYKIITFVLIVILTSLLFTGPGAFAFDLPL